MPSKVNYNALKARLRKKLPRKTISAVAHISDTNIALRDIYDKLEALQNVTEASINGPEPDNEGDTAVVETPDGNLTLAMNTSQGWMVDINSHFEPIANRSFVSSQGLQGQNKKPVTSESVKYDKFADVPIVGKDSSSIKLNVSDSKLKVKSNYLLLGKNDFVSGDASPIMLKNESGTLKFRNRTDNEDKGIQCSNIKLDAENSGVLLKNESGTLKVRDLTDSDDAPVRASRLQLNPVSGTSGVAEGQFRYDSSTSSYVTSGQGFQLSSALNGSSGDAASIVVSSHTADSFMQFRDVASAKWVLGYDHSDSNKFKIHNAVSIADTSKLELDTSGNLVTVGTITSSNGVCGGPAVTNYITNDAADVMTVSDFGANAALKIDADQPATTGAEDSIGLHIDYDRAVATSGTAAHNDIGIDLDVNTATLGTGTVWGMDIDVVGATSGTHTAIGADIAVSGADTNIGMIINSPGEHIRMQATADSVNDYATISVADTGDMSIATFGNGVRDSDLTLDIDGKIILEPAANGVWIAEATGSGSDLAGYGQLWIKNSSPNELCFTDDAGTDIVGVGKYMYDIQRIGYYATATASYIPMTGGQFESTSLTSGNERLAFIAPYDGTIEKVQWRSEIAQNGTTSFRILESSDGTEIPGTLTGRVDESIDIADDTTHEVDFSSMTSGDVNLDRGKIYSLYISHPSAPYDTNVTVVFKWDITSA